MFKKSFFSLVLVFFLFVSSVSAQIGSFSLRPLTADEFYKFIKVFSEMRGPIRVEILKDKKTDFKDADPLKYLSAAKDNKDVKMALKKNGLSWADFSEILGNVLLGYFSIQPGHTKASLIRQLSGYGLQLSSDQIPLEYQGIIQEALKTEEGSALASIAIDQFLQIPEENKKLAKKNKRQLDQLFYTNLWENKI